LIEDGYRQKYPMTWWELQDEPAEAIWEWLLIQNCRMKQQEMHQPLQH
jgi:endonuclease III-like uncharacterized protein